jgi:hypothetical protein
MKKAVYLLLFIALSVFVGAKAISTGKGFFQAQFMSLEEVKKKWKAEPFDSNKFKNGSPAVRASMASEIIERKLYVGHSRKKVREELGDPDGYFFSDTIYAFQIQEYSESKKESWQIVFIPDEDLTKVKEVRVHKKCCYDTPDWVK